VLNVNGPPSALSSLYVLFVFAGASGVDASLVADKDVVNAVDEVLGSTKKSCDDFPLVFTLPTILLLLPVLGIAIRGAVVKTNALAKGAVTNPKAAAAIDRLANRVITFLSMCLVAIFSEISCCGKLSRFSIPLCPVG